MALRSSDHIPERPLSGPAHVVLVPRPPYNFQGSFFKPSHFRTTDSLAEERTRWQTVRTDGRLFGLRISGNDDAWHPRISVSVYGERNVPRSRRTGLVELVKRRFDMESDITRFFQLVKRTPRGRRTLLRWMGSRPTCAYGLYELLVILICLQNAQVRRTESMMQHLFEAYGHRVRFGGRSLWAFWEAKDLVGQEDRLRELRLGYRARSLERLSRYFVGATTGLEARLWTLPDEKLVTTLRQIPGVGPATAQGLMFDYFHRYDSLACLAPWETKIFRRLLREPSASSADLVSLARRTWPGYSMLALHILFEDQFWRMREGLPNVLAGVSTPQRVDP